MLPHFIARKHILLSLLTFRWLTLSALYTWSSSNFVSTLRLCWNQPLLRISLESWSPLALGISCSSPEYRQSNNAFWCYESPFLALLVSASDKPDLFHKSTEHSSNLLRFCKRFWSICPDDHQLLRGIYLSILYSFYLSSCHVEIRLVGSRTWRRIGRLDDVQHWWRSNLVTWESRSNRNGGCRRMLSRALHLGHYFNFRFSFSRSFIRIFCLKVWKFLNQPFFFVVVNDLRIVFLVVKPFLESYHALKRAKGQL